MKFLTRQLMLSAGVLVLASGPVLATPITGGDIMNQMNLVVFGNLSSTSEVEGRTFVGGNLTGPSSTYFTRPDQVSNSDYAALTVGGNVVGGYKNINGSGDAVVGANVENMNMNGGHATIGGQITGNVNGAKLSGAAVSIPAFENTLRAYSQSLAGQAANGAVTVSNNRALFTRQSSGLSVFDISAGDLANFNEISFSASDGDAFLINVSGDSSAIRANFLGNASQFASHVLWNFADASNIRFDTQFDGSILAPNAAITNSNSLNGSVVARDFDQRGEVHLAPFYSWLAPNPGTGIDVPEPRAWLMFLLSLVGIVALSHYRRARMR